MLKGAADVGIVGKDVLYEQGADVLELLDLKFGDCRLVVAGPPELQHEYLSHNIRSYSMRYLHFDIFKHSPFAAFRLNCMGRWSWHH